MNNSLQMSVSVFPDESSVSDVGRQRSLVRDEVSQSVWVVDDVEQLQWTQLQSPA